MKPVTVKSIVPNVKTDDPAKVAEFYRNVLGMELAMDMGWIATWQNDQPACPQISFAKHAGSGAPFANVSIEVDDVDAAYERTIEGGFEIVYLLTTEDWGIRRFFVTDPASQVINISMHT
jgi:uncharacterized glyoxalase superfamily protein PhnB